MCLIITRTKGGQVDWQAVDQASTINRDGYGIFHKLAYSKVSITKSMKWNDIKRIAKRLERQDESFIIHMRYATHGAVKIANTHPFRLVDLDMVMAHNGIIDSLDIPHGMCDSRVLAMHLNDDLPKDWHEQDNEVQYVESLAGNSRLVFMTNEGEIIYINESLGAWKDGCWYSQPRTIQKVKDTSGQRLQALGNYMSHYDPTTWREHL